MVKVVSLLRKPLPPTTCLSTIAGFVAVVGGVLIFYQADSALSWDLWIPFGLILIAIALLLLELRECLQQPETRGWKTFQTVILIAVTLAVFATWFPDRVRGQILQ